MNFFQRAPFALLGAVGLVSLASGAMQLEQNIADWLAVWKAITRPIWEFLFGWIFAWIGIEMPWWLKDYLSMGAIFSGMILRMRFFRWHLVNTGKMETLNIRVLSFEVSEAKKGQWARFYFGDLVLRMVFNFFFWPLEIAFRFMRFRRFYLDKTMSADVRSMILGSYQIYFETFFFALIIIAINYALIFGGAPAAG